MLSSFFQFNAHAKEILSAAKENIRAKDSMIEAFSLSFTSAVIATNQTWPQVVMPDFEKQATIARRNSGAAMIGFCPIVYENEKASWEEFSVDNRQWLKEGLEIQGRDPATDQISPVIFSFDENGAYDFPGWYLPTWQQGPAPDGPIMNGDALTYSSVYNMGLKILQDKRTRLSDIVVLADFLRGSYSWYEEENKEMLEDGLARPLEEYE